MFPNHPKGSGRFFKAQLEENTMGASPRIKCSRCGGAMVFETFYGSSEEFWGLKCVLCGEVIDRVILENRERMRTGQEILQPNGRASHAMFRSACQ